MERRMVRLRIDCVSTVIINQDMENSTAIYIREVLGQLTFSIIDRKVPLSTTKYNHCSRRSKLMIIGSSPGLSLIFLWIASSRDLVVN